MLRIHAPGAAACTDPPDGFARVRTRHTWVGALPPFVVARAGLLRLAGGTLVNGRAAERAGVEVASLAAHDTVEAVDAEGRSLSLLPAAFRELRVGTASWARPDLFVADIPPFRLVHLHRKPAVWFGGDLVADRPFWLCLPERAVLIGEP